MQLFHSLVPVKQYVVLFDQVFLEYEDVDGSSKARQGLHGRKFGENQVVAVFYSENKFAEGNYDG